MFDISVFVALMPDSYTYIAFLIEIFKFSSYNHHNPINWLLLCVFPPKMPIIRHFLT
jgi:hypothetical protein